MSLPLFGPLLFSLLPHVKLYSTYQFKHSHSQTFCSLSRILLSHLSYQSYFLIDIFYMDVLGIQIQNQSQTELINSLPRPAIPSIFNISVNDMKIHSTTRHRNPAVTLDSTLVLQLLCQSPEPIKKTNKQRQEIKGSCLQALGNATLCN